MMHRRQEPMESDAVRPCPSLSLTNGLIGKRGVRRALWSRCRLALVLALAASLLAPVSTAAAQSQRFSDVPADHYAYDAVEWAARVGVTLGYRDGTFKPQRPLTKNHAVVFMQRYYDEILKAEQSQDFTRGDMMVLLKAINDGTLRDTGTLTGQAPGGAAQSQRFSDVPADHYAYDAVEWAARVGVTLGYRDGTFKPQRPLTKNHAVVFMQRYYDEILKAEQSQDFTRGDMMVLLKAINDGTLRDTGTGTRVAYIVWDPKTGARALYVVNADGTNTTKITDSADTEGWSPDGTRIAYISPWDPDTDSPLYVVNADGTNTTKITDSAYWKGWRWSPDGTRIVYMVWDYETDARALVVVSADGTNSTKIADSPGGEWGWSPDGTKIAYSTSRHRETWVRALVVVDADGTNTTEITDSEWDGWGWSPDGTRIAYWLVPEWLKDPGALVVVSADGTNSTKIADSLRGEWGMVAGRNQNRLCSTGSRVRHSRFVRGECGRNQHHQDHRLRVGRMGMVAGRNQNRLHSAGSKDRHSRLLERGECGRNQHHPDHRLPGARMGMVAGRNQNRLHSGGSKCNRSGLVRGECGRNQHHPDRRRRHMGRMGMVAGRNQNRLHSAGSRDMGSRLLERGECGRNQHHPDRRVPVGRMGRTGMGSGVGMVAQLIASTIGTT